MTFEFLIACRITAEIDIRQTLTELLTEILADKQNSFNESMLADMVQIRHQRLVDGNPNHAGTTGHPALVGFAVELPDETINAEAVITDFAKALPETSPIFHTVKFEDPLLQEYLADRAVEIYALEMKVRRVLSMVYLNACQLKDPFDLLRYEQVRPLQREQPTPEQMEAASENQFFHLTFGQYAGLNQRPSISLVSILSGIRSAEDYNDFRTEMLRQSITDEEDIRFISNLKRIMQTLDGMRNCVAHNRRPTRSIIDNYPDACSQVEELLNDYIARWEVEE